MSVIVELVDFLPSDNNSSSSLINLLKYKINFFPPKQFSLDFLPVENWQVGPYCYDVALSEDYYRFIVTNGSALSVFPRVEAVEDCKKSSTGKEPLFSVEFEEIKCFNCLKLVKEMDEEYIYATSEPYVVKIKVSDLMKKIPQLIWKSKETYTNIWD